MKNRLAIVILILVIIGFLFALWPRFHAPYVEIRAAMDIGSGATNMKIAKVNTRTDKIIEKIFERSIPVAYQKHLELSQDSTFDDEVMHHGLMAIKELQHIADQHRVKKIVAVATAAFRRAENASEFVKTIEKETGIKVYVIDQDEEGVLAFRGALALTPLNPQNVMVWDIGGGSMQLTTLAENGTYLVEKGETASIPFKNYVIREIQNKNLQEVQTPNPMSERDIQEALQYASETASMTDDFIKNKLENPSTEVLAVGSLFNYSIRPLVGQEPTPQLLEKGIQGLANKTDSELSVDALPEVAVTNPILVLGYMLELKIPQATILNVNNADGALTYSPYWEK